MLISDFAPELGNEVAAVVNSDVASMNMSFVMGYVFYFVLGYYICSINIDKKNRIIIYCFGLIGFLLTIFLNLIVALKTQSYCDHYYDNFTINVLLEGLAVFVFFKYHTFKNKHLYKVIINMSKYSFGAYLIHAFVLEMLPKFGINTLMCNPIISVPLIGIIVFSISYTISYIINKIPVLNKFIV